MADSNPSVSAVSPSPSSAPAVGHDSSKELSDKQKKALAKKAAAQERKAAARAAKSGDSNAPDASSDSSLSKSSSDHPKAEKKPKSDKKADHAKAIRARSKELPEFVKHRVAVWENVMKRVEEEKKAKVTENKKIHITLPDGAVKEGVAGVTSPYDIAMGISKKLAERSIIARINGDKLVDLMAPLHSDCKMELIDFETKEGKHVYWHSSAHILGEAIELEYQNAQLCIGPPLDEGGFYYDVHLGDTKVTPEDFKSIEELVEQVRKEKQPFIRAELTKAEALEMFKFNQFKTEIIKTKVPDGAICTAYRCGPLIDLCRGPHIPNTGVIGAMKVTKASSSYWLAKADQPSLQRIYGISFPTEKALAEWEKRMKLAEERDHRKVGLHQQLFFFDDISPGSCFFLPHGTRIYNTLCNFIRKEYWKRNYTEVISPNMYNIDLWRTSGHYENYKENMFLFEVEKQEFGLKPMNCPGHAMMFKAMLHSYRDLPLRYADFGVLHRNELSGALTGLTRVRRFQQDDAHIFCRRDQIEQEVSSVLDMLKHCYGIFGFQYSLALSTRPEKHLGEAALWDQAEKQLESVLNKFCDANGMKWALNPGDGAFYGPKIDIRLTDALGRHHQCATIQLDFQLPIRFDLGYKTNEDKLDRPVMIHRAILGSVERMIAVLTEHTGGKWPFWLSPRQAMIVPVTPSLNDYAEIVRKAVHDAGFYVDVDDSNKQFPRKIREAQLQQYNLILVVGEQEKNENSVTVRYRIDNVEADDVEKKNAKKEGKEQKEADGKDEEQKKKFEAQQKKFTIPDLVHHMKELLESHK